MTRLRPGLLALLLAASPSSTALADAVGPPPTRCPEGSTAVGFCHGPSTCQIDPCTNDGDCAAGQVCQRRDLCIVEHCCSGMCCAIDCGSPPTTYDHVAGACGAGRTCTGFGEACEARRVCVPAAGVDAGVDAGADAGADGGAGTDAGAGSDAGAGTDAGGGSDDAGAGTDAGGSGDAGPVPMDGGGGSDAGGGAMDASAGTDAGGGGGTDGGCGCRTGGGAPASGWALVVALGAALSGVRRLS